MTKQLLMGLCVLGFCAFVCAPMVVQADPDGDNPNSAFIQRDFGCGMFDGDGGFVATSDGNISIVTSSGHTTLICKAKGQANSTGRAVKTSGFLCGTHLGLTTDSQNTVSASGNITLRCRI